MEGQSLFSLVQLVMPDYAISGGFLMKEKLITFEASYHQNNYRRWENMMIQIQYHLQASQVERSGKLETMGHVLVGSRILRR